MRVRLAVPALALALAYAALPSAAHADTVAYTCETTATGMRQQISLDIELTVPTDATVGTQMTIGWRGSYVGSARLLAPTTGLDGLKMYAYAGISGIDRLTSATGAGELGTVTPGQAITLPATTVEMRTTATSPGTGTVHAAAVNFGPTPQQRVIECEVTDKDSLQEYPLTVPGTGESTSPSPDETTGSPTPDPDTSTPEDTTTSPAPTTTKTVTETPEGGVATGGGGMAGPDGRLLVATGLLVVLAATGGLWLRRPARRTPNSP
ncbi:hypothetical protein E1267_16110 [Nonomuraea longispora]|uniref:Peptidase n=1 Tax=Nonomuraea longispora TaxID=1848320 RepID=A0A4R4NG38_9ACTN|nr:hypothetical protein [Nonomuraea longispora]TDC06490.1 hypothetical protein E1267_16110 [Nonomuraea longispora]